MLREASANAEADRPMDDGETMADEARAAAPVLRHGRLLLRKPLTAVSLNSESPASEPSIPEAPRPEASPPPSAGPVAHTALPPSSEDPAFQEPWEAQVFALVLALHGQELFTWGEWSAALAATTRAAAGEAKGTYDHWLAALEVLLAARGVTDPATLDPEAASWARALAAAPRGEPPHLVAAPSEGFALDPRLAADTVPVAELPLCRVLLMDDARFPWVILVPRRPGAVEVADLGEADAAALMAEARLVSRVLRAAGPCDKLNLGALGNLVPQLHLHVVARHAGDAAWPGPVWGSGPRVPYAAEARAALAERLAAGLREG